MEHPETRSPNPPDRPRPEPELYTIEEVADLLRVPKATLYGWRYHGKGPTAIAVGRHLRYRRSELDRWLDAGGDDADPPRMK